MIAQLLVDVAQLPHDLAIHMRDGVQLVEGQQGFLVLTSELTTAQIWLKMLQKDLKASRQCSETII